MDDGVILAAVLVLLHQETSDQQCGDMAEALGEGILRCAYPNQAGCVY
jgi:hypothetical protein